MPISWRTTKSRRTNERRDVTHDNRCLLQEKNALLESLGSLYGGVSGKDVRKKGEDENGSSA